MRSLLESAVNMGSVMIEQNGGIKSISQHGKVELGKQVNQACHTLMRTHFPDGLLRNQMVSLR